MRQRFLLTFLVCTLFRSWLNAQQPVSEACARQKQICDSTLRAIYDDEFYSCFTFYTSTRVRTATKNWLNWNDSLPTGESVSWCRFEYFFQFPGAKRVPFFSVPSVEDTGVYLREDQKHFAHCGKVIDSTALDAITRKQLKQSLRECEVRFYTEDRVGTDKHPVMLDRTHVYLDVDYQTEEVKDEGNYTTTTAKHHYMIVDACTGEIVGEPGRMRTRWTAPKR